jgi:hypothetical protein
MSIGSGYTASTNGSSAAEQDDTSTPVAGRSAGSDILRSRPEVLVGAAFAGGILAALLLRRLGR